MSRRDVEAELVMIAEAEAYLRRALRKGDPLREVVVAKPAILPQDEPDPFAPICPLCGVRPRAFYGPLRRYNSYCVPCNAAASAKSRAKKAQRMGVRG